MIMNDTNKPPENKEAPETKKKTGEKKELTPGQLQKRKKMIVFPIFFLVFAACMWLIFAPSKKRGEAQPDGFNTELPIPQDEAIIGDKRDAYQQQAMKDRQQERIRSLEDFAFSVDGGQGVEPEEAQTNLGSFSDTNGLNSSAVNRRNDSFKASAAAYEGISRQLGNWYDEPATEVDEQSQLELEWRVQELERQLGERSDTDKQLALMEKSYEMAARYMPNQPAQAVESEAPEAAQQAERKIRVEPVSGIRHNVVSLLSPPVSDSVFIEEFAKPRNRGFNTLAANEEYPDRNAILACIHKTVTVTGGQEVQIRLLEPMRAGSHVIPRNTILSGEARINGERLGIMLHAVQSGGRIIPVEVSAYDTDGNEGVNVPGSEELTAVKEIAANMGTSMGSSITITDDAGSQLLSDLGRSVIQGTTQYFGKKMRTVKVTLKAGHKILLLSSENNN